jgi:hypothetical protein
LVVFNFGLLTHFENGTKFIDKIRDLFLNENEIKMKGRIESESIKKVPSFQLENDDKIQLNMKKLHEQRLDLRSHGQKFSNLGLFCVNDESLVDVKLPQVICYIFCYNKLIGHVVLK